MSTYIYPQLPASSGGATEVTLDAVLTEIEALNARTAGSLAPVEFDSYEISYVGATTDISTVVYKLGVATVKTLSFSYDGSNRLTGIVAT